MNNFTSEIKSYRHQLLTKIDNIEWTWQKILLLAIAILAFIGLWLFSSSDPRQNLFYGVNIHLNNKDYQQAVTLTEDYIDRRFEDYFGWQMRGDIALNIGNDTQALRFYSQAVERSEDNADIYYGLATATRNLGYLDQAVQFYEESLEIDPSPAGFTGLAITKTLQGDVDMAAELVEQAEDLGPELPETWVNMAIIAHLNFEYGDREVYLARARDLNYDTTELQAVFTGANIEDVLNLIEIERDRNNEYARELVNNIQI